MNLHIHTRLTGLLSAFGLALFLTTTPVMAMPGQAKAADNSFQKMDADKDGKVSKDEFMKAHPGMKDTTFDVLDKDKDGALTLEEWNTFMKGHGAMQQSQGAGGMPPAGAAGSPAPKVPGEMPVIMPPAQK